MRRIVEKRGTMCGTELFDSPPSLESVRGASDVVADVGAGVGVVVVAGVEVAGVVVAAAAAAAGARLARLAWEAGEGLAPCCGWGWWRLELRGRGGRWRPRRSCRSRSEKNSVSPVPPYFNK